MDNAKNAYESEKITFNDKKCLTTQTGYGRIRQNWHSLKRSANRAGSSPVRKLTTTHGRKTKNTEFPRCLVDDKAWRMVLHQFWQVECTMICGRMQEKSVVGRRKVGRAFIPKCVLYIKINFWRNKRCF